MTTKQKRRPKRLTLQDMLKIHPWLGFLPPYDAPEEHCPGCDAGLGEEHREGCTCRECTVCHDLRVECCECGGVETYLAVWVGVIVPRYRRMALEHNLYCRCTVKGPNGKWRGCSFGEAIQFDNQKVPVRWFRKCKATDAGAVTDVAAARRFEEQARLN
jgi:hypothetical protein